MKKNNIVQLIQNTEVEWKTLGEVAVIGTGSSNRQDEDEYGEFPFYVRSKKILRSNVFEFDEVAIVIPGEGGIGDIFHYVEGKYALHQRAYRISIVSDILNTKFLYYVMNSSFKHYILSKSVGATSISIRKPMLEKFQIPIPPLSIQQEIVKILDKLTELEATLEAELSLREKQYNYYRDQLLTFGDDVEWKMLGEVTLLTNNIKWKNNSESYRYIDLTSVDRKSNSIIDTIEINALNAPSRAQKLVKKDDVIFATTRPAQQRFALINDEFDNEIASTGYCVLRVNQEMILPKWIYYHISTEDFKNYVELHQSGSAYPAISDAKVKNFKIPTPPLSTQEKIVKILDKFDTLTKSITEGLPKEIELRRKQYEYYRELLLNFPKS